MFLSLDGTLIVQLINFAIFFAVLNVVFLRPVGRAIAERRAYIESLTADYDRAQAEASALRARLEEIRASARRQAEQIVAAARSRANDEAAALAADYARRVATIVDEAQRTVEREFAATQPERERLARMLAEQIAECVLAEEVA
jgi:F-type H+-transporting ATPase subunit b